MNIWWCNQNQGWKREYDAGVVCSSADAARTEFRTTVKLARKGDIVVHYRSGHGIAAISRALKDAVRCRPGDGRRICLYGDGWSFPTEYELLTPAIPKQAVITKLLKLEMPDSPVQKLHDSRGRIRQAYFMPITRDALQVVVHAGRGRHWPSWIAGVLRVQKSQSPEPLEAVLTAVEGLAKEARIMTRGRNAGLRSSAMERSGGVCKVCQRDFTRMLSGAGIRALHVHHNKQLSLSSMPRITSVEDLSVVCANCHALIHSDPRHAMTVSQLQRKLRKDGFAFG